MASNGPPLQFRAQPQQQFVPFAEVFQHLLIGGRVINLSHVAMLDGDGFDEATGEGEFVIELASGSRVVFIGDEARAAWQIALQITGRSRVAP